MEHALQHRERVGVQDFVLLEDYRSEAAFFDNLRKRFSENIIYVRFLLKIVDFYLLDCFICGVLLLKYLKYCILYAVSTAWLIWDCTKLFNRRYSLKLVLIS